MSCGDIITIILASATLFVTIVTLFWFMNDRHKQNKKEFEQIVYSSLKDISNYCFDIVKIFEQREFIPLNNVREAEQRLVLGFDYLRIYGISHNLPYLEEFSDTNFPGESYAKHFFELNEKYLSYRLSMNKQPLNDVERSKLEKYYNVFSEYLLLALRYSNKILSVRGKLRNIKDGNRFRKKRRGRKYYKKLNRLVTYSKKERLI